MEKITQCFEIPGLIAFGSAAALFLLAYILYRVLIFVFKKLAKGSSLLGQLAVQIRKPILWILLELAAIISLQLFDLPEKTLGGAVHIVTVCLIATIGWLLAGGLRAYYSSYVSRLGETEKERQLNRSALTQVQFLYHIGMFVIFAITVAAILLTFPYIKTVGVGILGSAGIAGIALGIAARPILLNMMAGFQIAFSKTVQIGDNLYIEGEALRVEEIHLTHLILRSWDLRRMIVPISYFIDKPFQNWDAINSELQGIVLLHCDYSLAVDAIRKKVAEVITQTPYWNGKFWNVHVTDCTEQTMEVRISASANDAASAFELRAFLREKLISFIQKEYPESLPCIRNYTQTT